LRRWRPGSPRTVAPRQRIPAHAQDVAERGGAPGYCHAAVGAAAPDDAGFLHVEASPPRHHQHLHIEGEPRDRQAREERFGGLGAEQLEPALRVHDPGDREQAHVRVEDTADQVAEPVLADPQRPWGLPRAYDDMRRGRRRDGVEEAIEVVGRHGEVGIGHEPPGAASFQHAALDGLSFSAAPTANQADSPIAGRSLFDDRHGAVGASIVNDDELPVETQPIHVAAEIAQGPRYRAFLVKGGDDDRQVRGRRVRGKR